MVGRRTRFDPRTGGGAGERDAIVEGFTDDRGIQNEAHTAVRACVVRPQWPSAPSAVMQQKAAPPKPAPAPPTAPAAEPTAEPAQPSTSAASTSKVKNGTNSATEPADPCVPTFT